MKPYQALDEYLKQQDEQLMLTHRDLCDILDHLNQELYKADRQKAWETPESRNLAYTDLAILQFMYNWAGYHNLNDSIELKFLQKRLSYVVSRFREYQSPLFRAACGLAYIMADAKLLDVQLEELRVDTSTAFLQLLNFYFEEINEEALQNEPEIIENYYVAGMTLLTEVNSIPHIRRMMELVTFLPPNYRHRNHLAYVVIEPVLEYLKRTKLMKESKASLFMHLAQFGMDTEVPALMHICQQLVDMIVPIPKIYA